VGITFLGAAILGAQAPPIDDTPADQMTAHVVARLLEQGHLTKPTINDEVSKNWCRNYLKALDPQKMYFEKADVEAFLTQDTKLDDFVREGNLDFAKQVFERYRKRNDERLVTGLELLKQKPDYTVDESIVTDPEKVDYPTTAEEARERWRKRIKYDLLELKVANETEEDAVRQLTVRYRDRNRFWHQFDMTELLEVYLGALTKVIDPHSDYMSSRTWEDFLNQTLRLSLEGIGARLRSEDGFAIIEEIVPGGAAEKDGRLHAEDKILGVIQDNGQTVDFVEKKLTDVVRYIRGPRGTKVKLIVQPEGTKERKTYELTREKIELADQHAKGHLLESKTPDGKPLKVGVISLPAFYGDTSAILNGDPDAVSATLDCKKHLRDFKKKGVNVVVVDLRGNTGGLLEESRTLSGLFIDTGPVVQVREASGVKHLDDDDAGTAWDGPLVVLIDKTSASASEIFAGVIQDYGRGLIIGDSSTYGKGTVQSILPINETLRRRDNMGALKITIQQFYRADGASTQIEGVKPDIHIPSLRDQLDIGEGKIENALKFDKVRALKHDMFNRVPTNLVAQLSERSAERRKSNDKFRREDELIKKYTERKNRKEVSLNEKTFRSEFVSLDEDNPDADPAADPNAEPKPKAKAKKRPRAAEGHEWKADYYNDEVLAIVGDYVTLGSKALASAPVRVAQ